MPNLSFLLGTMPPQVIAQWRAQAAAAGIPFEQYVSQGVSNAGSSGFGSGFSGGWGAGGGNVAGIPGLGYPLFRRAVMAGAAGSVGAGIAGAAGGGGLSAGQSAAAGVDPFVAGGGLGAAGGGAAAGAAAGTPWYNTFLGQTGINSGINLLGGALQNSAQGKADAANRKAIEDRIRQALAALSPEHIMSLAQQFMPQMAANMSQAGQTAIQAVRSQAARTGQLEGPRALNYEAGTRAKLAGDVQSAAFERAFNVAGNQANAITGAPYIQQQPRMGYADAVTNSANQAYFARAMSQQPPQQPGVPWRHPYTPGVPMYGQY